MQTPDRSLRRCIRPEFNFFSFRIKKSIYSLLAMYLGQNLKVLLGDYMILCTCTYKHVVFFLRFRRTGKLRVGGHCPWYFSFQRPKLANLKNRLSNDSPHTHHITSHLSLGYSILYSSLVTTFVHNFQMTPTCY